MGSESSPAWGRLVRCMASGTDCVCLTRFVGVSRKTLIKSSMNPSTLPELLAGPNTDMGRAGATGTDMGRRTGSGARGWDGLNTTAGFQARQFPSSFAESVTSSENRQKEGGLGQPPNVSLKAM